MSTLNFESLPVGTIVHNTTSGQRWVKMEKMEEAGFWYLQKHPTTRRFDSNLQVAQDRRWSSYRIEYQPEPEIVAIDTFPGARRIVVYDRVGFVAVDRGIFPNGMSVDLDDDGRTLVVRAL